MQSRRPVEEQPRAWADVSEYVHSLGLDAYLVGGAVRDELLGLPHKDQDFVVPNVGLEELRTALAPHGRVDDLEVAGQRVGLRLFPRDRDARALAPAGIEFAPPRAERSTGPGRHDFAIVPDASLPLEADMERRDFTVNAMARSLATGELVDPFGGREDLERARPPHGQPDQLSRRSASHRARPAADLAARSRRRTSRPWRRCASTRRRCSLVSGERIGGGLGADGLGELSKLLLGGHPAKALRIARDTGVLTEIVPEYGPAIGFEQESRFHALPSDEHHFEAVQAAADAGAPLSVRLALFLHDLGKPASAWRGDDGPPPLLRKPGARQAVARGDRRRARRPRPHAPALPDGAARPRPPARAPAHVLAPARPRRRARARRFLARHGVRLAFDLVAHKDADVRGKGRPAEDELARLAIFRGALERERRSPHRLRDLAIGGDDLIALGFRPGPALGRTLEILLQQVVGNPSLNTREWLTAEARRLLEHA